MFKTLLQQNLKKFDIRGTVSNLVRKYYEQREQEGKVDGIWQEFRKKSRELELNVKSYSQLTPGTIVIFNYVSLKGVNKAYMAVVVGARGGQGVYNNTHKKTKVTNTLMSCFLIDDATDLNTLAAVVDVLLQKKLDSLWKSYKPLVKNENIEDDVVRQKANISESGMAALFPTSEFRTFLVNIGMKTLYKVNFNG